LAAIGVLAYGRFEPVGTAPFALALLTLLAAGLRTAFAFHDLRTSNEARRSAVTDDLTGLPNRYLFQSRLAERLARTGARDHGSTVMVLDLKRFKDINNTLGHESGDELLRQIGPRLESFMHPADTLARLGGDEFGVILPTTATEHDAVVAADRIHAALEEPFRVQDLALHVEATVGIALFPTMGDSAVDLIRHAEIAMNDAKKSRATVRLYQPQQDTNSRHQLTLATELAQAIGGKEIELYFQPQADADTGRVVAVEALVRWRHPVLGLLQPAEFIPLAETAKLIRPLTGQVMDAALAQCAAWRADGLDLRVSVNVSASDLLDSDLPRRVAAALTRNGLPAATLVIELTESSVLADPLSIPNVLNDLHELGVGLSLDDFGTGFSSLAHVNSLPVDEIKIDQTFVSEMTSNPAASAIVETMIELARTLGKRIVAEGIEDHDTWQKLASKGCNLIQGYALSPPVPADALAALIRDLEQVRTPPTHTTVPTAA